MNYFTEPKREAHYYAGKLSELKAMLKERRCATDAKMSVSDCPVCNRAYQSSMEELTNLAKGT